MGIWKSAKAQTIATHIGEMQLDALVKWGWPAGEVFCSVYHLSFLFRFLVYLAAAELQTDPNSHDVIDGVAIALDKLRKKYYSGQIEHSVDISKEAFGSGETAMRALRDAEIFLSAQQGDPHASKLANEALYKYEDNIDLDLAKAAGFDIDNVGMRFYAMVFVSTLNKQSGF